MLQLIVEEGEVLLEAVLTPCSPPPNQLEGNVSGGSREALEKWKERERGGCAVWTILDTD